MTRTNSKKDRNWLAQCGGFYARCAHSSLFLVIRSSVNLDASSKFTRKICRADGWHYLPLPKVKPNIIGNLINFYYCRLKPFCFGQTFFAFRADSSAPSNWIKNHVPTHTHTHEEKNVTIFSCIVCSGSTANEHMFAMSHSANILSSGVRPEAKFRTRRAWSWMI